MIKQKGTIRRKIYDLEERTFRFALNTRDFAREIPFKTNDVFEYCKQLIRSSSSVAANYIEANEALSKKDFFYRMKIVRKESKESRLWLRLIFLNGNEVLVRKQKILINESLELTKIFSSILVKNL